MLSKVFLFSGFQEEMGDQGGQRWCVKSNLAWERLSQNSNKYVALLFWIGGMRTCGLHFHFVSWVLCRDFPPLSSRCQDQTPEILKSSSGSEPDYVII